MSPETLAALHAAAFAPARGWSAEEFAALCNNPHVTCYGGHASFALVRSLGDEAELLTLAVDPQVRREGKAEDLMRQWLTRETANTAFLEVAADNHAAQALYRKLGFTLTGRRKDYYKRKNGTQVDALLMQLALKRTCTP